VRGKAPPCIGVLYRDPTTEIRHNIIIFNFSSESADQASRRRSEAAEAFDRSISPSFLHNAGGSNSPGSPLSGIAAGTSSPCSPENYVSSGQFSTTTQFIQPNNFAAFSLFSAPFFRSFPTQTETHNNSALVEALCNGGGGGQNGETNESVN